jgi:hypothetical protein
MTSTKNAPQLTPLAAEGKDSTNCAESSTGHCTCGFRNQVARKAVSLQFHMIHLFLLRKRDETGRAATGPHEGGKGCILFHIGAWPGTVPLAVVELWKGSRPFSFLHSRSKDDAKQLLETIALIQRLSFSCGALMESQVTISRGSVTRRHL